VDGELVARLSEIAPSYLDVWQREHKLDPATRRALEEALGPRRPPKKVAIEKGACHQPELFAKGGRVWGFMVQLYGVRSQRNWGVGDFGDLRALVELAASLGAGVVGVNPLHAAYVSPYSPSSRHALNTVYLEIEAIPEFAQCGEAQRLTQSRAFLARLLQLRKAELVDYDGVRAAKHEVLGLLHGCFRKDRARRRRFAEWRAKSSKELRDYALYEALREELGSGGWQSWPKEFQDPSSPAVRQFERKKKERVEFHAYLQWNARQQLDLAQRRAEELAMPVGLYFDLALGADRGGAEVWSDRAAYATAASIGAPPDEFNPRGQDWGLPPYSPRALRAAAYRPFVELLRANMPRGGALRLDHVMALARLYWIPPGNKADRGGYVHYPLEELLGLLAQESRRNRCMVIGEDLGTVTGELRQALNHAGVLSYRPLFFEKGPDGGFSPPEAYPREALTCVSTHDLPTWRGFWAGHDLELREQFGLTVDPKKERAQREAEKEKLERARERQGFDISAAGAHALLARTPSKLLMVQPEDVFELVEQANLPGTVDQHPNWRRKLPLSLERWKSDPRIQRLAATMAERSVTKEGARFVPKRLPVATYRLQLHKGFRLPDATGLVPYLARLGASHVYASPFLKARPGSMHGYDVADHGKINPEIGTEADLKKLLDALRRHGMGLVMDLVPNHMGVLHGDNPWWQDVLEKGRASPYAKFFDIDWERGGGKLLLPVLGRHYGEALEAGEIKLARAGKGAWRMAYFDQSFPLNPKSVRNLKPTKDPLAMHRLLEKQHYRLAFWRVASDEINYRRFFEIADLAALRTEDPAVFDATHSLVGRLAAEPGVDGLRIDHPDGLSDPEQYFERLQGLGERPWIVVEKILASYEALPAHWKVHGTTGYRFASLLTGVFVDHAAAERFERIYQRFTGERASFDEISRYSRLLIMSTTLAAELAGLAQRLARIASGNRRARDYTETGLRRALAEIAALFPVYRTYVSARGVSDSDRRYIDWAVKAARRASRVADPSVFDFVRSVLTLEAAPAGGARRRQMLEFAMRFQQLTAPVVAKGVEDTAFYRYHRLIALNEVGNDPRIFGFSLKAFHAASDDRAKHWPGTMLGSSTHDTKRSEDVRARLGVLSEMSSAWLMLLRRWHLANRSRRTDASGESLPTRADEYHFYQALIGIWPVAPPSPNELEALKDRLRAYMLKAVREAKLRTSWINPDAEYEAALERFVVQSLESPAFVKEVNDAVPRIARLGMLVSLSQALLKVASPGVPDYYQGTELFDFSLVDPDNRRPVDYALRTKFLDEKEGDPGRLLENLADGRAKLHIIRKGLAVRRAHPGLFHGGQYVPLHADSGREDNLIAFALCRNGKAVIAVAPRLFARLMREDDLAPIGERVWGAAVIALPHGLAGKFQNLLTGEEFELQQGLPLARLLARFPVALLANS
jgi:(1->4)-alpha-D-glucan 1-alpha-D-glucosylmutase